MTSKPLSNKSTIYFAPLSTLVPQLRKSSLSGIVPRYLLKVVPNGKVPLCQGFESAAFAIGGIPLRRPEAQFHWVFGENNAATSALCQFLKQGLKSPKLYFHPNIIRTILKHFPEDKLGTDKIWVSHCPVDVVGTSAAQAKTFNSMPSDLKFSEEIASRLPPEELWQECRFEYIGLEVNGIIEATAEYTVEDGEFCLIQQLFTSTKHRNAGLSKMLLSSLSSAMHKKGITPVMISCSKNEIVSSVARRCGFKVAEEVGTVEY
ncbi:MAG: GNAT family N-acetyltransferase [Pseudomonadota bacterium]